MEPEFHWETWRQPLIFLITAGVVVPLFRRLRVSPVLGFLIAGALLGPFGAGRLAEKFPVFSMVTIGGGAGAAQLAELGVVFLLFMIGLELSWDRLMRMRRLVFGLGAAQVVVTTALLTLQVGAWLDLGPGRALICAAALSMSSTAIVLSVLSETRRLNTTAGRAAFAVLLFQDLMVAPLLFMVPLLDAKSGPLDSAQLFWTWAPAVVALFVLVAGGRLVLRPLFQLVAAAGSTELFMAACLLVVVGASVASGASRTRAKSRCEPVERKNRPSSRPWKGAIVTSISRRNSVSASSRPAMKAPSPIDRPAEAMATLAPTTTRRQAAMKSSVEPAAATS